MAFCFLCSLFPLALNGMRVFCFSCRNGYNVLHFLSLEGGTQLHCFNLFLFKTSLVVLASCAVLARFISLTFEVCKKPKPRIPPLSFLFFWGCFFFVHFAVVQVRDCGPVDEVQQQRHDVVPQLVHSPPPPRQGQVPRFSFFKTRQPSPRATHPKRSPTHHIHRQPSSNP